MRILFHLFLSFLSFLYIIISPLFLNLLIFYHYISYLLSSFHIYLFRFIIFFSLFFFFFFSFISFLISFFSYQKKKFQTKHHQSTYTYTIRYTIPESRWKKIKIVKLHNVKRKKNMKMHVCVCMYCKHTHTHIRTHFIIHERESSM